MSNNTKLILLVIGAMVMMFFSMLMLDKSGKGNDICDNRFILMAAPSLQGYCIGRGK